MSGFTFQQAENAQKNPCLTYLNFDNSIRSSRDVKPHPGKSQHKTTQTLSKTESTLTKTKQVIGDYRPSLPYFCRQLSYQKKITGSNTRYPMEYYFPPQVRVCIKKLLYIARRKIGFSRRSCRQRNLSGNPGVGSTGLFWLSSSHCF